MGSLCVNTKKKNQTKKSCKEELRENKLFESIDFSYFIVRMYLKVPTAFMPKLFFLFNFISIFVQKLNLKRL